MGGWGQGERAYGSIFSITDCFQCYAVSNDAGEPPCVCTHAAHTRTKQQFLYKFILNIIFRRLRRPSFSGSVSTHLLLYNVLAPPAPKFQWICIYWSSLLYFFWRLWRPNFSGYVSTHLPSYNFSAKKKPFETLNVLSHPGVLEKLRGVLLVHSMEPWKDMIFLWCGSFLLIYVLVGQTNLYSSAMTWLMSITSVLGSNQCSEAELNLT